MIDQTLAIPFPIIGFRSELLLSNSHAVSEYYASGYVLPSKFHASPMGLTRNYRLNISTVLLSLKTDSSYRSGSLCSLLVIFKDQVFHFKYVQHAKYLSKTVRPLDTSTLEHNDTTRI